MRTCLNITTFHCYQRCRCRRRSPKTTRFTRRHGNKYYALVKSFKASSTEIILARREMLNMTYGMQTGSRVCYVRNADDWVIGVTRLQKPRPYKSEKRSLPSSETNQNFRFRPKTTRITNLSRTKNFVLETLISITILKYV